VSFIKTLGDAYFFLRRKIGLLSLRTVSQSCIVHQYFIFCHFTLTFKKNPLSGFPGSGLKFRLFKLILFRDQASYEEANYNVANYYFLNVDRVHSANNHPCLYTNFFGELCQ
jgi:hypothetical protein